MSFKSAAEELHVTPPAVSHQIRVLEKYLGLALFQRVRRGIRLTNAGTAYFYRVSRILEGLANASTEIRQPSKPQSLKVTVMPQFLADWLVPRLGRFFALHPGVDVKLIDHNRQVDFEYEDVDAAIWQGNGEWPGVELQRLADMEICAVCSPSLLEKTGNALSLKELHKLPLIHIEHSPYQWERVLRVNNVSASKAMRALSFLHAMPALQAAMHGLGVALANKLNVEDALVSGKLVIPFALSARSAAPLAYYFVLPHRALRDSRIEQFRVWLATEISRSKAALRGLS